mmetsp:Transcript_33694/g.72712  ORF Transcript_33694/g.72712 Transcript_33694/m.72712 type:complete len:296 (+) Transcript_33694:792-1679(+)
MGTSCVSPPVPPSRFFLARRHCKTSTSRRDDINVPLVKWLEETSNSFKLLGNGGSAVSCRSAKVSCPVPCAERSSTRKALEAVEALAGAKSGSSRVRRNFFKASAPPRSSSGRSVRSGFPSSATRVRCCARPSSGSTCVRSLLDRSKVLSPAAFRMPSGKIVSLLLSAMSTDSCGTIRSSRCSKELLDRFRESKDGRVPRISDPSLLSERSSETKLPWSQKSNVRSWFLAASNSRNCSQAWRHSGREVSRFWETSRRFNLRPFHAVHGRSCSWFFARSKISSCSSCCISDGKALS